MERKEKWITGMIETAAGVMPVVATALSKSDILGGWKVRWNIGRFDYTVNPGIYAAGAPDKSSPVFVTANYKLTFDALRKELSGLNCWILVLDTDGINVWCSSAKGTFGTSEVCSRISSTNLCEIVDHKNIILPQLSAAGVCAHEVAKQTGFKVIYGPVRAKDIKAFLNSGCKADEEMRTVKCSAWDRAVLTPVELVAMLKITPAVLAVLFLINLFAVRPFGLLDLTAYGAAAVSATVVFPVLLPILPGKAFAFKGWLLGLAVTGAVCYFCNWFKPPLLLLGIGYMLLLPAFSAFLTMNFTGCSTFTSYSGVKKEMKFAMPLIALFLLAGTVLVLIQTFTG